MASGSPVSPEPTAAVADEIAPLAPADAGAEAPDAGAAEAAGVVTAADLGGDFFDAQPEIAIVVTRMPTESDRSEANRVMRPPRSKG